LAAGLELLETLLGELWKHVHPQLDSDDGDDPQLRVNILAGLCDSRGLLQDLRECKLVDAPAFGRVSLRDIELVSGELTSDADPDRKSQAMIQAVFSAAAPEQLSLIQASLDRAFHSSLRIESILTERVGVASAIDLSALSAMLRRALDAIRQRLPQPVTGQSASVAPDSAIRPVACGDIASRDDVRHSLDRICAYFVLHEPGSPVPLLLQRARKLLDLNFMELLQDLAPNGVPQMALVSGMTDRKDE
jgi:type VI secretion system protein ImpA